MKLAYKNISEAIDDGCQWVQFKTRQIGFGAWVIYMYAQQGDDIALPLQYPTKAEAMDVIAALTFAYNQGMRMQCRQVINKMTFRAKFKNGC